MRLIQIGYAANVVGYMTQKRGERIHAVIRRTCFNCRPTFLFIVTRTAGLYFAVRIVLREGFWRYFGAPGLKFRCGDAA